MSILVVLELDVPTNVRILGPGHRPADPQGPVRRAHAARADPDASGACGPLTLCGLETGDMTLGPHRSADLDEPWWPSRWHACSVCETARRDIAPPPPPAARRAAPAAAPADPATPDGAAQPEPEPEPDAVSG
ncbi:hypothetical protein [Kitasatospora sp. NPDC088346]|uniref:hypothetical protein n=1 Tax=Kitasatospora sp. NPDC088346 TaxID=3364073 RepID=UPI0037FD960F